MGQRDRLDLLDYYTLLGVSQDAGTAEIKRAFRNFARRYHPDRFAGGPPEKIDRATQIYRRGSEAYRVLTDPIARQTYDQQLPKGHLRLTAEQRDRAVAEAEKAQQGPKRRRAIDQIQSPQARAFYRKAVTASKAGDWRGAWKALNAALEHDPGNEVLQSRLTKVEARIRRM
jgi:curved DNA-binding protein CbpA